MKRLSPLTVVSAVIFTLLPRLPGVRAQEPERIYAIGEHVGTAVVSRPEMIHPETLSIDLANTSFMKVALRATLLVGVDGSVRDVSISGTDVWVSDRLGMARIDRSDPRWNAAEVTHVTNLVIRDWEKWRFQPATLNGEPVPVRQPVERVLNR